MPRIYRLTAVLAAGLLASVWFATVDTTPAAAQDEATPAASAVAADGQACPPGATCRLGHGVLSNLRDLHGNDIENCRPRTYGQPDLFYNYYVPGTCGGVPAAMYVAPQPVPAWVGHTYYTYQPFLPHELLYQHHRHYYRYYDQGRGLTRTSVSWYRPPIYIPSHFRIAR
jgi:hypothetical protein